TASPKPPVLLSPTGVTANTSPTFTWQIAPGASWHYLWVSNSSGTPVFTGWFQGIPGSGVCDAAGVCSAVPTLNLAGGTYNWWIQGWGNGYNYGPWSTRGTFQVSTGTGSAAASSSSNITIQGNSVTIEETPTEAPTDEATLTEEPTVEATVTQEQTVTAQPTQEQTVTQTAEPTQEPTVEPTAEPTQEP